MLRSISIRCQHHGFVGVPAAIPAVTVSDETKEKKPTTRRFKRTRNLAQPLPLLAPPKVQLPVGAGKVNGLKREKSHKKSSQSKRDKRRLHHGKLTEIASSSTLSSRSILNIDNLLLESDSARNLLQKKRSKMLNPNESGASLAAVDMAFDANNPRVRKSAPLPRSVRRNSRLGAAALSSIRSRSVLSTCSSQSTQFDEQGFLLAALTSNVNQRIGTPYPPLSFLFALYCFVTLGCTIIIALLLFAFMYANIPGENVMSSDPYLSQVCDFVAVAFLF